MQTSSTRISPDTDTYRVLYDIICGERRTQSTPINVRFPRDTAYQVKERSSGYSASTGGKIPFAYASNPIYSIIADCDPCQTQQAQQIWGWIGGMNTPNPAVTSKIARGFVEILNSYCDEDGQVAYHSPFLKKITDKWAQYDDVVDALLSEAGKRIKDKFADSVVGLVYSNALDAHVSTAMTGTSDTGPVDITDDINRYYDWVGAIYQAAHESSPEGQRISLEETGRLLSLPLPFDEASSTTEQVINRWNRSVDYWQAGIYSPEDVPQGQSTDFVEFYQWQKTLEQIEHPVDIVPAMKASREALNAQFMAILTDLSNPDAGICASVSLKIEQRAIVSRNAFRAFLELNNEGSDQPIENIDVSLKVLDINGFDKSYLFLITPDADGDIDVFYGTDALAAGSSAATSWTLIPSTEAAPLAPQEYSVTGTISYRLNNETMEIPLFPEGITVLPNPVLDVKYFLEQRVYSDDPFTEAIEPAIPFSLGMMITNHGYGIADNFRITSSEPVITENRKHLAIDFQIIGATVDLQIAPESLNLNVGDIAPAQTVVAKWLMTASLQGEFTKFRASYEHVDGTGEKQFSLVNSLDVYRIEHAVRAQYPKDDGIPDFLAYDNVLDLPAQVHFSNGTVADVVSITEGNFNETDETLEWTLTIPEMPQAWTYIRLPNPQDSQYKLISAVNDKGQMLIPANVWTTHRTIRKEGLAPYDLNQLHVFDHGGSGVYTLKYQHNDTELPVAEITVAPDIVEYGVTDYVFNVMYTDNVGLIIETLGPENIVVKNEFITLSAELIGISETGSTVTATYRILAPNGMWTDVDNGVYAVELLAGRVANVSGQFVQAGLLASFSVVITPYRPKLERYELLSSQSISETIVQNTYRPIFVNDGALGKTYFRFDLTGLPENVSMIANNVVVRCTADEVATLGSFCLQKDHSQPDNFSTCDWIVIPFIPADLNDDGVVDLSDLATLASCWMLSCQGDIYPLPDGDGITNWLDLALFAEGWMKKND